MKKIKLLLSALVVSTSLVSLNAAASSYDSTLLNNNKMSIGISQEIGSSGDMITKNPTPWTVGSWGNCSAKCDPSQEGGHHYTVDGYQYRSVSCNDANGVCDGPKPSTSQSCYRSCYARNKGH